MCISHLSVLYVLKVKSSNVKVKLFIEKKLDSIHTIVQFQLVSFVCFTEPTLIGH